MILSKFPIVQKSIQYISTFLTTGLCLSGCGERKESPLFQRDKFEWRAGVTCPNLYPIRAHASVLIFDDGYTILDSGIFLRGKWGETGSTHTDSRLKKAPYRLVVHWISYIEEKLYKGVFDLPTEKMTELFREEYINFRRNKKRFDYVVVGLAPEGMVVVWLWSPNKCVEVGCYWAEESNAYTIRQIAPGSKTVQDNKTLADYAHTMWTMDDDLVENFNKNGLGNKIWDIYRERFNYRVVTEYMDGATGITDYIQNDFYNGEMDCLKEERLQTNDFNQWARMKFLNVVWSDQENIFEVNINFDEEEVFQHFATIFPEGEDRQAEMVVQIAPDNLHNLLLRSTTEPSKEVIFHKADVKVYRLGEHVKQHISVLNPKKKRT